MKHLKKFDYSADRQAYLDNNIIPDLPYVHYVESTDRVVYSGSKFKSLADYPIYIKAYSNIEVGFSNPCEYSKDNKTWHSFTGESLIPVARGECVFFRAKDLKASSTGGIGSFGVSNGSYGVGGNIMSLLYGEDFRGKTELPESHCFYDLFLLQTGLKDAKELILPATTLTKYCYCRMFMACISLETYPQLPAMVLSEKCYAAMFSHCISLTNAPELSATTLSEDCYYGMFYNCISLTNAPKLNTTELAVGCYREMFSGCTSLTTAPELPATTLADYCYSHMFEGCTGLTEAPVLPAKKLVSKCYDSMFYGTNVLPDLSHIDFLDNEAFSSGSFRGLFAGTKVTDSYLERILPKNEEGKYYIPVITNSGMYEYSEMFKDCTLLVTAPELPATTLAHDCYGSMFSGCTSLVNAPKLNATKLVNACYSGMFSGCTSLVNAPELPATTLAHDCYSSMFSGCTSLVNAPKLPATKLVHGCYGGMFRDCTSLNSIKMLATDISAAKCLSYWVYGVASTGTFVKNAEATWDVRGVDGIPEGWTVETATA